MTYGPGFGDRTAWMAVFSTEISSRLPFVFRFTIRMSSTRISVKKLIPIIFEARTKRTFYQTSIAYLRIFVDSNANTRSGRASPGHWLCSVLTFMFVQWERDGTMRLSRQILVLQIAEMSRLHERPNTKISKVCYRLFRNPLHLRSRGGCHLVYVSPTFVCLHIERYWVDRYFLIVVFHQITKLADPPPTWGL